VTKLSSQKSETFFSSPTLLTKRMIFFQKKLPNENFGHIQAILITSLETNCRKSKRISQNREQKIWPQLFQQNFFSSKCFFGYIDFQFGNVAETFFCQNAGNFPI